MYRKTFGILGLAALALIIASAGSTALLPAAYADACSIEEEGDSNLTTGICNTISGGRDNWTDYSYSTIGGGWKNRALAYGATVGGGAFNQAGATYDGAVSDPAGRYATIGGGNGNIITANYGTIGGGGGQKGGLTFGSRNRTYTPTVRFTYAVDGTEHESDAIVHDSVESGTQRWAQKALDAIPDDVVVRYDPKDPATACLRPPGTKEIAAWTIAGTACSIGGIVYAVL